MSDITKKELIQFKESLTEEEIPTVEKIAPIALRHMKNGVVKFYADINCMHNSGSLKLVNTHTGEDEPFILKRIVQKLHLQKIEGEFENKFQECPDASRYEIHYVAEVETEIVPVNGDGQPINASPIKQSVLKKTMFFIFAPILSFFEKRKTKKEKMAREKFLKTIGRASEVMKRSDQMAVDEFCNIKIINKPKLKLKRKA